MTLKAPPIASEGRFSPLGLMGTLAITEFFEDFFWVSDTSMVPSLTPARNHILDPFLVDFNRTCVCKVDVDILPILRC